MQPLLICLLLSLASRGAQESLFVKSYPEKPMVEYGGFVVINCTTNCNFVKFGIETFLPKEQLPESGTSWKVFRLGKVNQWKPHVVCYFDCEGEDLKLPDAGITVYQPPNHVDLDPVPTVEVGKNYTLTCRFSYVAPIQNVTVTFLRGGEKLHQKTFEENSNVTVVTHNLTAQRADHDVEFSCEVALDLRPHGQLFEKASHNQSLRTVVFPLDPYLQISENILETNNEMPIECYVAGVFPAEEAQFDLTFAGESLNFSISMSGDRVTAYAQVSSSSLGYYELNCAVSLGPVTKTTAKTMHIYSLPQPILNIDRQEILVNETANVMCSSQGTEPPGMMVQIRDAKQVLISGSHGPLQVPVTAQEEDDGKEFTCEVLLMVDEQRVQKDTSVKLTVFYGPQMNDSSCPTNYIWKDGNEETFICSAWGNPAPTVECSKDKVPYPIGIQQPITKEQDGIYQCNATNLYGSVVQNVIIQVETYQIPTLAISLGVLITVAASTAAIVAYRMYYQAHKIRKYRLKKLQDAGTNMEAKCLNGNAQNV